MTSKASRLPLPTIIVVYIIVLVLWTTYRLFTHNPEIIDESVAKPLLWLAPILIVYKMKKLSDSYFLKKTNFPFMLLSAATGVGLALLQIIPNIFKGYAHPHISHDLPLLLIATVCTAVTEELFFRSFLLGQLQLYYNRFFATLLGAALFAGIHIPLLVFVSHLTGIALATAFYTIFVSGVAFGILFLYTKNVTNTIIAHFILNVLLLVY